MPHLHIPLQSGSDDILLRMNRRYTTRQFSDIIDYCKAHVADIAIGIDVLAGFPGESAEQFDEAYDFLHNLDFTYLHVFPYSRRPGTPAADYGDQVARKEKERRVTLFRQLSETKRHEYYGRFVRAVRPVLVEGKRDGEGNLRGFSDNYIPVACTGEDSLKNRVVKVQIESVENSYCRGTILAESNER